MYEVEVKVPADLDAVRGRLRELGAEPLGTVRQVDTYYDAPHRDFAATDEALRVREETAGADDATEPDDATPDGDEAGDTQAAAEVDGATDYQLTYKGPKVDAESKTRTEHESRIGDPEAVDATLQELGFEPVADVTKERERYALRGYTVTLDAVEGAGEFVEVERRAREVDLESVRDDALDLLGALGLDPEAGIRTSYLGLVADNLE